MKQESYVSGAAGEPLLGETIGDNFDRAVAAYGNTVALVSRHQAIRWTYDEFADQVRRCAKGLLAQGVDRGDRVGIWSPNRAEWAVLQYATAKIGAVLVNVNPAYRTHEVRYALEQSGCSFLVAASTFKTSNYVEMVDKIRADLPALRQVLFLDSDSGDLMWSQLQGDGGRIDDQQLVARQAQLQFDDPINIQYTSGTTGFPKGATLSHHNILNNAYAVTGIQGLQPGDALCIPVPLYHCFGMVMGNLGCTTRGLTMVYPDASFDPVETLRAIAEERCRAVYGVPTMFIAMLDAPELDQLDVSSLRTGVMAGSPCPIEVMKRAMSDLHLEEVTICYGMTETSPVSFQSRLDDDLERRVSTVGRVHPWVECKIVDDEGHVVPRGQEGELCTRGYSVMLGYWNDEEATGAAIDGAGWMHTGDVAVMRDDGYVNIVGRLKDMIIRGGENIYPREIEEFLYSHPDIADVQVIGVPDEKFGEEICAWVRLRDGADLTLEALRAFCEGEIAHYKIPRYLKVVSDFPMTVTGKVRKVEMRSISTTELGLADAGRATA